jgi:hypothetical protein
MMHLPDSCCLTCESCEIVDYGDDYKLFCSLSGHGKWVDVRGDHVCDDYKESIISSCFLMDAGVIRAR